jgi:repressor LexA
MEKTSRPETGKPSKRQAEILEFIAQFQKESSYSPSLKEIAVNFDISIPTVHEHISFMKEKSLLGTEKGRKRSIQTFNNHKIGLVNVPLLGYIAAGKPIEPIINQESVEVPRNMLSRGANHYALRVTGESMINEGIMDGDIVLVREQARVENGEKAVAYLPDTNEVTLKKLYVENNRFKLVPANKNMKPFYKKNVEVQGKVIGVLRTEL